MDPQAPPPRPADAAGGSGSDFTRFDDTGYPVAPEPVRRRFPAWPAVVAGIIGLLLLLFGIGLTGPIVTFAILGIPPLLAGVYAGVQAVDRATIDAARAVGLTEWQILGRVEILG